MLRYLDNMTSERVDAEGVKNVAAAAKQKITAKVWHFCQSLPVTQVLQFPDGVGSNFGFLQHAFTCTPHSAVFTVRQQSSSRMKSQL